MVLFGNRISYRDVRRDELESVLETQTVAEIKEVIDRLGNPVPKSGRKADVAMHLTQFLRYNPQYLVNRLSWDEVELIQRVRSGEKIIGDPEVMTAFYLSVQVGWLRLWEIEDDSHQCQLVLAEEAERLIGDLVDGVEEGLHRKIARFVLRWGSLCGILPVKEIVSYLSEFPEYEGADAYEVTKSVQRYIGPKYIYFDRRFDDGRGDNIVVTPWCMVTGSIGELMVENKVINGKTIDVPVYRPKRFSYEEIMEVGVPLFSPLTPNASARRALVAECKEAGMEDVEIEEVLLHLWICKQQAKSPQECLSGIPMRNVDSIEAVNRFLSAESQYCNTLPFWKFMGRSSEEIFKATPIDPDRPPRLVAGPNMRAAGMDITPEQQRMFEAMLRESELASRMPDGKWPPSQKVGRNDPCPCGSGKKFKNCCGR